MNNDKKPTFFVSRRGRHVGVHEVDMNGIDIESNPDSISKIDTPSVKKTKTKTKSPVSKKSNPKNAWSSRKKLTILTILAAIIFIPLVLAELVTTQYSGGISRARQDMKNLVDTIVLPAQKKSTLSAVEIREVSVKVNEVSTKMCRGGLLDNLAQLYPRAKRAHDACKESQRKYVALTKNLNILEAQARYLEKIGTIIKPVSTPITDDFAVIGAQQATWVIALEELKKVEPPSEMKPAHSELVDHVNSIADTWSKLNTANNTQDQVSFEESEKALLVEYEAVRTSSAEFTSILSSTQSKVLSAYDATK